MDSQVWDKPVDWPIDHPDYVFLARAFHQIGRAKLGADWDYESPDPPDPSDELSFEEWEKLDDAAEARTQKMYADVQGIILEQCRLGVLEMAARPLSGGKCVPLTRDDWNSENCGQRFKRCQISERDLFASDDWFLDHWLFVDRGTLQRYIATFTKSGKRPGLQAATVQAILQLWPRGVPAGLKIKERDQQLRKYMADIGASPPSASVIRRAFAELRRVRS
jgi:hypothetical protein